MPGELIEVLLCERFGWTLHYVRSLPLVDIQQIISVLNADMEGRRQKAAS